MKKIISVSIIATMILSMFVYMALPVSAVEGEWSVYADKETYFEFSNTVRSIPGYEYNGDGLHMIPANWSTTAPYGIFQTSYTQDLRSGVYMEVRVDDFTYGASDKWISFQVGKLRVDEFNSAEDSKFYGNDMIVRLKAKEENGESVFDRIDRIEWWQRDDTGSRSEKGTRTDGQTLYVGRDRGCPVFVFELFYDRNSGYSVRINGADSAASYNQALTSYIESMNHQAYISFAIQNSELDGTVECTILKYGSNASTAQRPVGDDRADPIDQNVEYAEIASPDTVPPQSPALVVNGSTVISDLKSAPTSYIGTKMSVNDDCSITMFSNAQGQSSMSFRIKDEVSYDADDFPYMAVIVRDFCTCTDQFACMGNETIKIYGLAGTIVQEQQRGKTFAYPAAFEADYVGDHGYMLYLCDWTDFSGRIHGARLDIEKLKSEDGRNQLDVCEIGFFASSEDASNYYAAFIEMLELEEEENNTDTEYIPDVESDTEFITDTEIESEIETENEETLPESESETKTVESEDLTDAEEEESAEDNGADSGASGGCGSVVGIGSIVVAVALGAALCAKKKKK